MKVKPVGASIFDMLTTGYILDSRFRDHKVPPDHPERPERISALLDLMARYDREGLVKFEPRAATTGLSAVTESSPGPTAGWRRATFCALRPTMCWAS